MSYLLSRSADPIFGVFSGLLAFHLTELRESREKRSASTDSTETLKELLKWKYHQRFPPRSTSALAEPDEEDEVFKILAAELKEASGSE
ncbi:hypothetical protein DFH28DRAFT_1118636 [Melampsora americana]|nr:hypothetical protein DFH28DRAFT_1118636 [Melampsora americana]